MDAARDISRESCPSRPRVSHHLRPKKDGRGAIMVCQYCEKTSAQIRASVPTDTIPLTFTVTRPSAPPQHPRR